MKKTIFALAVICCSLFTLCGADNLWDGNAKSLRIIDKEKDTKIEVADGKITMSGISEAKRYHYLAFRMRSIKPFILKEGQAIRVTFEIANAVKEDSFYVKTRTANSKHNNSWNTYNVTGKVQTITFIPGKSGNGINWLAMQIKAPANAVATDVEFYFGRRTKNSPMKFTVYKVEIVDVK